MRQEQGRIRARPPVSAIRLMNQELGGIEPGGRRFTNRVRVPCVKRTRVSERETLQIADCGLQTGDCRLRSADWSAPETAIARWASFGGDLRLDEDRDQFIGFLEEDSSLRDIPQAPRHERVQPPLGFIRLFGRQPELCNELPLAPAATSRTVVAVGIPAESINCGPMLLAASVFGSRSHRERTRVKNRCVRS